MNVVYIHASDLAAFDKKDDSQFFGIMLSRLANTGGSITIETPPRGLNNSIYDIYMKSRLKTDIEKPEGRFKIFQVTAREAVAAGLITQEYGYYVRPDVFYSTSLGIDPAYGSSKFGMVVTQFVGDGNKIRVLHAKEFEHPNYEDMVQEAYYLISKYQVDLTYIDAAGGPFISSLKRQTGERSDYQDHWKQAKEQGAQKKSDVMSIVDVNFGTENREMLAHSKHLVEAKRVCIHPDFKELLDQMRAAQAIDGKLDKSIYTHDLMDAFMLALKFYQFNKYDCSKQRLLIIIQTQLQTQSSQTTMKC